MLFQKTLFGYRARNTVARSFASFARPKLARARMRSASLSSESAPVANRDSCSATSESARAASPRASATRPRSKTARSPSADSAGTGDASGGSSPKGFLSVEALVRSAFASFGATGRSSGVRGRAEVAAVGASAMAATLAVSRGPLGSTGERLAVGVGTRTVREGACHSATPAPTAPPSAKSNAPNATSFAPASPAALGVPEPFAFGALPLPARTLANMRSAAAEERPSFAEPSRSSERSSGRIGSSRISGLLEGEFGRRLSRSPRGRAVVANTPC